MPEIFRNLLTTGGPDSLALPTHADGPHINLPGNFSFDPWNENSRWYYVVIMCVLLAAAACLPKESFPVQSNVTTELQATSRKDRDRRDIKKLCSSQDPVKQNSRCALFQIIDYCNYFHYTHYVFTSRFVPILVSQITCGRTNAQLSPSLLIPWVISFVLPRVLDGFHTSGTTINPRATAGPAVGVSWRRRFGRWGGCLNLSSSCSCWLGSFQQWKFTWITIFNFGIMCIIVQIIAIIVK